MGAAVPSLMSAGGGVLPLLLMPTLLPMPRLVGVVSGLFGGMPGGVGVMSGLQGRRQDRDSTGLEDGGVGVVLAGMGRGGLFPGLGRGGDEVVEPPLPAERVEGGEGEEEVEAEPVETEAKPASQSKLSGIAKIGRSIWKRK